jgi:hypothetical protein
MGEEMNVRVIRRGCIVVMAAVLACVAGAAVAHHSFAMFDMSKTVNLSGTIKKFEWTNPHTWLWLDVKNAKGEVETWGFEGMSPNYLGRRGWSKDTLQAGAAVSVVAYPLKDGLKGGSYLSVTLPNGKVMSSFERPPAPTGAPPAR